MMIDLVHKKKKEQKQKNEKKKGKRKRRRKSTLVHEIKAHGATDLGSRPPTDDSTKDNSYTISLVYRSA